MLGTVAPAVAADPRSTAAPPAPPSIQPGVDEQLPVRVASFAPHLATPPGPAAALEGYAGIALLVGPGDTRSRGLVGGLLRLRFGYAQIGGSIETTDSGQSDSLNEEVEESWRTYQGFAGVWLPFEHWIDMDASLGYAVRRFTNPDPIYGANGLDVGGSAITWRFGISDRFGEKRFAARLGAALLGTIDLGSLSAPYERHYISSSGAIGTTRGTTDFGGVSFALVIDGGFEVGGGERFRSDD